MKRNFKFISSLALAGLLTTGIMGTGVLAETTTDTTATQPLGIYKKLVDQKSIVPFILANRDDRVTIKDIKDFKAINLFNGEAVASEDTVVHTGDTFTTTDGVEHTVVIYGDVDENGLIDEQDARAIQKHMIHVKELDKVQLEAANVVRKDKSGVDESDAVHIQKYLIHAEDQIIDEAPEQEVQELTYALDEEKNNNNTDNEVKGVTLENNVITVKVDLKGYTADQVYFYLKDLPEGATIEGTKSENGSDATKKKVFVRAKEGTYEFTIKTDNGTTNVTVNVVNVTMPTFVQFKALRTEEVTSISDEAIRNNTDDVVKSTQTSPSTNTFAGNVNLMKTSEDGEKYYRVRVELKNCVASDVIAINKDTLKEYKVETIEGAPNEIYVYLDANEAKTPLVLKHKDATDKQVKDAEATTVTFKSTSAIWLRDTNNSISQSRCKNNGTLAIDSVNNQVIDVGVDFDNLTPISFTVENGEIDPDKVAKDTIKGEKWLALSLNLTDDTSGTTAKAVYTEDNDDNKFILDKRASSSNTNRIVWVRAEKEGTIKFTLKYNLADNKVEELPITVNLHDTKAPMLEEVTSNTTGIINTKVENDDKTITVDSYKYGMDATVERKENKNNKVATKGRWYSLELKTNVDISSLVYKDEDGNWAEIPEDMISNGKIVVWLNADKTEDLAPTGKTVITLANRYAQNIEIGKAANGNGTEVKVKRTEKTKLEINKTQYALSKSNVEDQKSLEQLYLRDITVVESELKNPKVVKVNGNDVNAGTLQYNLAASRTAEINMPVATNDIRTATLKINSNDVSTIKVNGVEGKWIVVHMTVKGNIDTLVDETNDTSSIIIDPSNIQLLKEVNNNGEVRVPIWINLSSPAIKAVTSTPSKTVSGTVDVKFGSTGPVVEHNSFKLKIEDTNAMEEELKVEKPKSVPTSEITNPDGTTNKEAAKNLADVGGSTVDNSRFKEESLLNNMKVLADANIEQNIVDDTVYVTVKTDLTRFQYIDDTDKVVVIPMTLDASALDISSNKIWSWSPISGTWNEGTVNSSLQYNLSLGFRTEEGSVDFVTKGTSVTKEILITNKNISTSDKDVNKQIKALEKDKAPYIRYVITFVNNK